MKAVVWNRDYLCFLYTHRDDGIGDSPHHREVMTETMRWTLSIALFVGALASWSWVVARVESQPPPQPRVMDCECAEPPGPMIGAATPRR